VWHGVLYAYNILTFVNGRGRTRTDKSYNRHREPTGKPRRIEGGKAEAKWYIVSRNDWNSHTIAVPIITHQCHEPWSLMKSLRGYV
jgi:hypothetical protein